MIQVERGQLLLPYPEMAMDPYWLPEVDQAAREDLRKRLMDIWSLEFFVNRREDILDACEVSQNDAYVFNQLVMSQNRCSCMIVEC